MRLFKPKQAAFFDLFKDFTQSLRAIAGLYGRFAADYKDFETYAAKAKDLEHEADEKTHKIIEHLNKTFITPFDREDIYMLAHELDDTVDLIENVIHSVFIYHLTEKNPAIGLFAPIIEQGAEYTEKLVVCMEAQKYTKELVDAKIAMHALEDRGDEIFDQAIGQLFDKEKDAISLIKQKYIIERLEKIADKYQKISDIIEGIIVKSS